MPQLASERFSEYLDELQRTVGHEAVAEEIQRNKDLLRTITADREAQLQWNRLQMLYMNNNSNQLMLSGLNKGGKTTTLLKVVEMHATGRYPAWYKGHRFDHAPNIGLCGVKAEPVRDNLTDRLFGPTHDRGIGMIPADCIVESLIHHKHGGCYGQIDKACVKWHRPDGSWNGDYSNIWPWAYTQNWQTVQSYDLDLVAIDEEAPQKFYEEMLGRISGRDGQIRITLTPLQGKTALWRQFHGDESGERTMIVYGVDDCEHWTDRKKTGHRNRFAGSMDESARVLGLPVEGSGLVYQRYMECVQPVPDRLPTSTPQIIGVDITHTSGIAACVRVAFDQTLQKVYVLNEWKAEVYSPQEMCSHVRGMGGAQIPIAWPHDTGRKSQDGASTIALDFRNQGLNMLPEPAYMEDITGKRSNSKNAIIYRVQELIAMGKLVISPTCVELIEELSDYRHDKGIVMDNQIDHLIDALHNALRMERFASTGTTTSTESVIATGEEFWNFNAYGE